MDKYKGFDFIRIAAVVPTVSVGDVAQNTEAILKKLKETASEKPQIIVFPELSLTGYTCADLFFQQTLSEEAYSGLRKIMLFSKQIESVIAVGLPVEVCSRLYNCAAIVQKGTLRGLVPKTYVPNYNEFYEKRWFGSASDIPVNELSPKVLGISDLQEQPMPIGNDLVFDCQSVRFGVEICEDLWATIPPSASLSLGGAEVILNLSASNETIAKRRYRRSLVQNASGAQLAAYAYVSAGCSESTTDLIFSGHSLVCENGKILAENADTISDNTVLYADVDLGKLRADRRKNDTFAASAEHSPKKTRVVSLDDVGTSPDLSYYTVDRLPFVPNAKRDRVERCMDIFEMQVMGLKKRMDITRSRPVIGVSGGLDSTLALLVSAEAVRRSGRPLTDVVGITMPCFGTTDRTYQNSLTLMKVLGVTFSEIPIADAVEQHFKDIGHDRKQADLTFENSQARERTQVLMDYAGKIGGFVVGTGDLSELALGWCTYNADHMSMYGVNAGIPKTLVRWLIDTIMECELFPHTAEVLRDILDTPISPELLPPDEKGQIAQQTEEIVGPYALHDFYLYYTLRYGFAPEKTFMLACKAFDGSFDRETIKKWLITFYRRFFTQQFKRSCLPDGVKIGSVCLSPRGDWRMPSDASSAAWVKRAENL